MKLWISWENLFFVKKKKVTASPGSIIETPVYSQCFVFLKAHLWLAAKNFLHWKEHLTGSIEVVNTLNSLQCLTIGTALSLKTPCLQNYHPDNYFCLCLKIFLCTLRHFKRQEKDGSYRGYRGFLSSVGAMLIQSKIRNSDIYICFSLKY